jgi:NTE family protein
VRVIVTDVLSAGGRELRRSRGPEAQAVMAAWQPRECLSVDGGVSDNTPISHAVELGADEIYVPSTGHACALREPPRGRLAMLRPARRGSCLA